MAKWADKTFKTRADLMVRVMNLRWPHTERIVQGMLDSLKTYGKDLGKVVDVCCGNGRVSTHFALKGFTATGIDYSPAFIEDAKIKAEEHHVADKVDFILGDVRDLDALLGDRVFDVVVNAWTSIGYTTWDDDAAVFRQARTHVMDDAVLFIIDTMHQGRASMNPRQMNYVDLGDMLMLETSSYDMLSSRIHTVWRFYRKSGDDLLYEDECEYDIRVYSLSELASLLYESGWHVESYYGSIVTKQPMSPHTGMNIVAKAIK